MDRVDIVHENFRRRVFAHDLPPAPAERAARPARGGGALSRRLPVARARPHEPGHAARRPGFLHHRLIRARGHGRRGGGAETRGHGVPSLSRRRLPDCAGAKGAGADDRLGHAAVLRCVVRRSDFRRPAQSARARRRSTSRRRRLRSPATCRRRSARPIRSGWRAAVIPSFRRSAGDSIIVCSFGDASANHSTAQGAFNTAAWTAYQNAPLPILFICEDNGIGISTKTPAGWIKRRSPTGPVSNTSPATASTFLTLFASPAKRRPM